MNEDDEDNQLMSRGNSPLKLVPGFTHLLHLFFCHFLQVSIRFYYPIKWVSF